MRKIRKLYVQKVLPLVYDYSLSVSEMVGKLIRAVNDMADDVEENTDDIENIESTVTTLADQTDLNTRSIDTISGKIEDIEHELDNVPTDARIEELQEGINQNASDIASLDGRVDILESQPDLSTIVSINTSNISTLQGDVSDLNTAVQGKSTVSYTRDLSSGTKIGSISIDSVSTDIYAPTPTVIPGASGITYDNTQSGMQASNVQDAIDELDTDVSGKSTVSVTQDISTGSKIGTITVDGVGTDLYAPSATVIPPASGILYDNTTSGLTATDVQAAIDEIDGRVDTDEVTIADIKDKLFRRDDFNNSQSIPIKGIFSGFVTNSLNDLFFYVPLKYEIGSNYFTNMSMIHLSGTITVRGNSGYVNVSGITNGQYTFGSLSSSNIDIRPYDNGIIIKITGIGPFTNVTNNTSICVYTINSQIARYL